MTCSRIIIFQTPSEVGPHVNVPATLIPFISSFRYLGETFALVPHYNPQLLRKIIRESPKSAILFDIWTLRFLKLFNRLLTMALYLGRCCFPKKLLVSNLKSTKDFFSVSSMVFSNSGSFNKLLIWRPSKISAINFASLVTVSDYSLP